MKISEKKKYVATITDLMIIEQCWHLDLGYETPLKTFSEIEIDIEVFRGYLETINDEGVVIVMYGSDANVKLKNCLLKLKDMKINKLARMLRLFLGLCERGWTKPADIKNSIRVA